MLIHSSTRIYLLRSCTNSIGPGRFRDDALLQRSRLPAFLAESSSRRRLKRRALFEFWCFISVLAVSRASPAYRTRAVASSSSESSSLANAARHASPTAASRKGPTTTGPKPASAVAAMMAASHASTERSTHYAKSTLTQYRRNDCRPDFAQRRVLGVSALRRRNDARQRQRRGANSKKKYIRARF